MEAFELVENITEADIDKLVDITVIAWAEDRLWRGTFGGVSDKDVRALLTNIHQSRVGKPYSRYFAIRTKATNEIIGWTSLLCPEPAEPNTGNEKIPKPKRPDLPGIDKRLGDHFFLKVLGAAKRYGYDPTTDFHRRGTFIHPDYQRRGFGIWLTNHCNSIADEVGGVTWVGAGPMSKPMFEKCGFEVVAVIGADLKGDGEDIEDHWVLRRDAVVSGTTSSVLT